MDESLKILNEEYRSPKVLKPYTIPDNYFDNLSFEILLKVAKNSNTYILPVNYFDTLPQNILNKIKQNTTISVEEELNDIAPFLNKINKKQVYQLPENYFSNIPTKQNVVKPTEAKVISIKLKVIYKYAVAAAVVGFIVMAGLTVFNKPNQEIALMHKNAIKTNVAESIVKLSDAELNSSAAETENTIVAVDENTTQISEMPFWGDVNEEMQHLSEEEITYYLNNNLIKDQENNTNS